MSANETKTRRLVIAIDGPAGSGKSTLASRLARKLGYLNIETGGMYRALALKAIQTDTALDDESALLRLAQDSVITLEPRLDGNRVLLDGKSVTDRIREQDVTDSASRVSVHPRVREWMVARQREMGAQGGVVMEGRDIGTKVFPDAEVKIFLEAAPEVRGQRRFLQHQTGAAVRSSEQEKAAVVAEMKARDERDRHRAASPLVPAPDAIVLDTSNLTLEEVIEKAEELVRAKSKV